MSAARPDDRLRALDSLTYQATAAVLRPVTAGVYGIPVGRYAYPADIPNLERPDGVCLNCWRSWLWVPRLAAGGCHHASIAWRLTVGALAVFRMRPEPFLRRVRRAHAKEFGEHGTFAPLPAGVVRLNRDGRAHVQLEGRGTRLGDSPLDVLKAERRERRARAELIEVST